MAAVSSRNGGVFGGGSGGADGNDTPRRGGDKGKKPASGKLSEREKAIRAAQAVLDREFNTQGIKWSPSLKGVKLIIQAKNDGATFTTRQKPSQDFSHFLGPLQSGSLFKVVNEPELRTPGKTFNVNGSAQYLPTIAADMAEGAETADNPCTRCQSGAGPFANCRVMPDGQGGFLFHGACTNCAYGLQYTGCSLSDYTSTPRRAAQLAPMAREESDMSMVSNLSRMSIDQLAEPQGCRRFDGTSIQHSKEFASKTSGGSQKGQAIINFNYSSRASHQEMMAEMHSAIRRVADEWEEASNKGMRDPFNPNKKKDSGSGW